MGTHKPEDIRNVAIVGHGGAGKTALTEALLFDAGVTTRMGKVEDGNTVTDFGSEEQKRQISINAALATIPYNDKTIYVLDTPGYADFIGDMRSSMRVVDSAIVVLSGVHGVEVQTEKAWEFGQDFNIPMVFYLSKMGRENADFDKVVGEIQEFLSEKAMPFYLPLGTEANFKGVIDVLGEKAYVYAGDGSKEMTEGDIPQEYAEAAQAARDSLVERIVEADDELMMRYLDGENIGMEELVPALREAVRTRNLFPVLPGDSGSNVGVLQVLDLLVNALPAPCEMSPRVVLNGEEEVPLSPDPAGPFVAFCFKIMVDPYVGKLSFLRVLSGSLSSDNSIYNVNKGEEERISAFKVMTGKEGKDAKEVVVGDIIAIPKLHSTAVADTLGVKGCKFTAKPIQFPKPVYSLAVIPQSRGDEDKLSSSLHKLLEEDPTLAFEKNVETGDNVLSGMGDVHLDIVLSRIKERYGVELETKTPKVPYRETIRKPQRPRVNTRNRPEDGANTEMCILNLLRKSEERVLSSAIKSWEAWCLNPIFPQ